MRISLNGSDWLFKDFYGEDWRWRDAHQPDTRDVRWWRSGGSVPGSVLDDLWRLGEIADPYRERNSLLCEWVAQRSWLYKRTFGVPEELRKWPRARLVCEGVDYEAEFFLNGELLGMHQSMYVPAVFEVGGLLQHGGENLLTIAIAPAPAEQPQVGRTDRVRTHKARMNYWWDFCPRLVHQGIWDDVYLEFTGPARIEDVAIRPRLSNDFGRANVGVTVTLDSAARLDAEVTILLRLAGVTVAEAMLSRSVPEGQSEFAVELLLDRPQLWWPNGYGGQPLYECEVTVVVPDSPVPAETWRGTFGVRRIEFAANDTPDDTARAYTFVVNGRKVYANGWNWVPIDALYGVPRPAKLERLLTLAKNANVNLLRVWGGGLIEKSAFYDLCDRFGIMVWQELIQSSSGITNSPSTDEGFIAMLAGEAERIIPRRRNHPSLALWCGGNELQGRPGMLSAPDVNRDAEQPLDDDHPALAALKAVVERLDPGRLWLPTSPTGRAFGNSLDNIESDPLGQHDVHGPWEYQGVTKHYTLYNAGTSLLHSEFGVEGFTNRKTLDRVLPREKQWPVNLAQNRDLFHLGAWWIRRVVWDEVFGPLPDVESYVRATQFTQADGLRYALEADRRRQWRNSGVLPWQFNEPYPMAACTSAVDYWAEPKPAYYAVARAYAPVSVTASFPTISWEDRDEFEADLWAVSAGSEEGPREGVVTGRMRSPEGFEFLSFSRLVTWHEGGSAWLAAIRYEAYNLLYDIFFLDLELRAGDGLLATNRYVFTRTGNLAALVAPQPSTTLRVEHVQLGNVWRVTITNTGNHAAYFVWLEDARERGGAGWPFFDDNYFCLFPGERRTVTVSWSGVPEAERRLEVRGWNTGPAQIRGEA